jgi:flagellar hook-length control protein FliK
LGLDFAQLMAKQFQQLTAGQRQDLAAVARQAEQVSSTPEHDTQTSAQSQDKADTTDRNTHAADTAPADPREAQTPADDERRDASSNPSMTPARPRTRTASAKPVQEDAQPAWMTQHTSQRPANQSVEQAQTATSRASADIHGLRTIELSPQVRIITDPGKAPSPESLTEFAKAMGLDEAAIQKLMGHTDARAAVPAAVPPVDANAVVSTSATVSTPNTPASPNALLAALQAHTDGRHPLGLEATTPTGQAPAAASLNSAAFTATLPPALTDLPSAPALNATLGTSLNAPLQPMTAAEMASIQQIQITVLPAAVLPVGTPIAGTSTTPSTLDMLSLLGGSTPESEISALVSAFSQGQAGESDTPSQGQSSDSGNPSGFAQALTRQNTSQGAGPSASAQATSSTHMSEVYDQLSDKLATEMAARMHKQLSDGEWKMKFGLRPANLGGVEIQLEMKDGKLDAVFRADNPLTRDLLQNSSQRLRDALENFGIQAGQVQIGNQAHSQQQNPSNGSAKQPQVRDNSPLQVNASNDTTPVAARNKANASLLDLYA